MKRWIAWLRFKLKGWKTALLGTVTVVVGSLLTLHDTFTQSGIDPHLLFPRTMSTYKVGLIITVIGFAFTLLRGWTNTRIGSAHFDDGTPAVPTTTGKETTIMQPVQADAKVYKLGRQARLRSPYVPHLSAWLAGKTLTPVPAAVDWTAKMNPNFGMMLNDRLGCCTCSAFYHARQLWTANVPGGKEQTDPDKDILRLYEWAAGYNPNDPSSDEGAVCQNILKYVQHHGAPIGKEMHWDRILGFVELDPRNIEDVKRVINETGVAYIGFSVPSNILPGGEPPEIWTVVPGSSFLGGHCIVLAGYNDKGAWVISWGKKYFMTWEFFLTYCDEAYGIVAKEWFDASGHSVLGMTASELEQQMAAINALQLVA